MDYGKFEQAEFKERTAKIPVEQLRPFFPDVAKDKKPIWELRCVTASEMFYAKQAEVGSQKSKQEMVEEFIGGNVTAETREIIKAQMGLPVNIDDAPVNPGVVFRRHLLIYGSIPRCPENIALKMSNEYGLLFTGLTNKLLELYSGGNLLGESNASGETEK